MGASVDTISPASLDRRPGHRDRAVAPRSRLVRRRHVDLCRTASAV